MSSTFEEKQNCLWCNIPMIYISGEWKCVNEQCPNPEKIGRFVVPDEVFIPPAGIYGATQAGHLYHMPLVPETDRDDNISYKPVPGLTYETIPVTDTMVSNSLDHTSLSALISDDPHIVLDNKQFVTDFKEPDALVKIAISAVKKSASEAEEEFKSQEEAEKIDHKKMSELIDQFGGDLKYLKDIAKIILKNQISISKKSTKEINDVKDHFSYFSIKEEDEIKTVLIRLGVIEGKTEEGTKISVKWTVVIGILIGSLTLLFDHVLLPWLKKWGS